MPRIRALFLAVLALAVLAAGSARAETPTSLAGIALGEPAAKA